MNIRIADGTLRFRLGTKDLEFLKSNYKINQVLQTGLQSNLSFSLDLGNKWRLSQNEGSINIEAPKDLVSEWLEKDDIELNWCFENLNLKLMIEKDLHRNKRENK